MARRTISLPDERHRALREVAALRGETIGEIIEASLDYYGIKSRRSAAELALQEMRADRGRAGR